MNKIMLIAAIAACFSSNVFARNIQFSSLIPAYQKEALESDLLKLKSWELVPTEYDSELMQVMEVDSLNSDSLIAWLEERVGYIVSEDFDRDNDFIDLDEWFSFPNPYIYPSFGDEDTSVEADPNQKLYTVMANIGVAKYLLDKSKRDLFGINFRSEDGDVVVPLKSPRVGLIQIGEGLFHQKLLVNKDDINAESNSIMRLITLFHEARHSDGNGTSLGFFHAVCPKGHRYQGKSVCDKARNGAYAVDGLLTLKLIQSCQTCTEDETALLTERAQNSLDRVLQEYTVREYTDAVKKRISEYEEYLLNLKEQWNSPYLSPKQESMIANSVSRTQEALDRLMATGETIEKVVPTRYWDASPE